MLHLFLNSGRSWFPLEGLFKDYPTNLFVQREVVCWVDFSYTRGTLTPMLHLFLNSG
ncbi:UNVERIFIED_CONTAM: hypothetical protein FKN15_062782 [Acipenser sinensis]